MKAILSYPNSLNLGDEIQSVAAERLIGGADVRIDREHLYDFSSNEKVKLLCNGWFMTHPKQWPPSSDIDALFVSMHISRANGSHKHMFSPESINYFKRHAPVGCRDFGTLKLFQSHGIPSYFSNCLTLTLKRDESLSRNDDILMVDAFRTNYNEEYREYNLKRLVPEKYWDNVKIINQKSRPGLTVDERFEMAESLIKQYSQAKVVITSRIHCAIPCLALGTPVYFVNAGYHSLQEGLDDRFEGIIDMFRLITEDDLSFSSKSVIDRLGRALRLYEIKKTSPLDIDWENPEPNDVNFSEYVHLMKDKVNDFFKN